MWIQQKYRVISAKMGFSLLFEVSFIFSWLHFFSLFSLAFSFSVIILWKWLTYEQQQATSFCSYFFSFFYLFIFLLRSFFIIINKYFGVVRSLLSVQNICVCVAELKRGVFHVFFCSHVFILNLIFLCKIFENNW